MKEIILWLFGLEEEALSDPTTVAGIIASFVVIAACLAVFITLIAKRR